MLHSWLILGFDLPAGSRFMIPELELESVSEPIVQKNFVTKWIDSFANTLSVWVQNAGWCKCTVITLGTHLTHFPPSDQFAKFLFELHF